MNDHEPFARLISEKMWDVFNSAHEAHMEEKVRKVVEEFRERAAQVAKDHNINALGRCACMDEIAEKIRALPTEQEDKK